MSRAETSLNRERLLDKGVALLVEQGYHATGLQELVRSAGIPKGSFYNYFASKEAFSAEVVKHYIEPFIDQLDRHLGRADLSAEAALATYFGELAEELERRQFKGGCLLGNLIGEIGDTSDLCQASLRDAVHRYRNKLRQGILRGQKEGAFRADIAAEDLADLLVDAWQGALLRMKIERSARPLTHFRDMVLGGYLKG